MFIILVSVDPGKIVCAAGLGWVRVRVQLLSVDDSTECEVNSFGWMGRKRNNNEDLITTNILFKYEHVTHFKCVGNVLM